MKKYIFISAIFLILMLNVNLKVFAQTADDYIKTDSYIKILKEKNNIAYSKDYIYTKNNIVYIPLYIALENDLINVNVKSIDDIIPLQKSIIYINSKSYIPLNNLNAQYNNTYNVLYTGTQLSLDEITEEILSLINYDNEDFKWLSKIIYAEARGENYESKLGVGNVIINRVNSNIYPNTIKDVILDRKFGVQFSPVLDGSINNNSNDVCKSVALDVLIGINNAENALFFMNPSISETNWISQNRLFLIVYGNHHFYL